MASKIPSWLVSVVGAIIVIAATALSSISLHETRTRITEARSEITTIQQKVDNRWNSHRQADERATAADIFYAEALGQNSDNSFLLGLTVDQLRGAVLSMYAAAKEQVPDETPESIESLLSKLRKGDRDAYMALKSEINELRLASMRSINELSDGIRSAESRVHSLEVQEGQIYFAYFAFNLLGLIVVMCKDLPVWKKQ